MQNGATGAGGENREDPGTSIGFYGRTTVVSGVPLTPVVVVPGPVASVYAVVGRAPPEGHGSSLPQVGRLGVTLSAPSWADRRWGLGGRGVGSGDARAESRRRRNTKGRGLSCPRRPVPHRVRLPRPGQQRVAVRV